MKTRSSTKALTTVSAIAAVACAGAASAAAGTGGGTGGLPWEAPLTLIVNSMTGPVAFAVSVIALVLGISTLAFSDQLSGAGRYMVYFVLIIAMLVAVVNLLQTLFGVGATGGGSHVSAQIGFAAGLIILATALTWAQLVLFDGARRWRIAGRDLPARPRHRARRTPLDSSSATDYEREKRTKHPLVRTTVAVIAAFCLSDAFADVRTINITSSASMSNSIDDRAKRLGVRWRGSLRSGEYCYIVLDSARPTDWGGTWRRHYSYYSCEMSVPYAVVDSYYGATYGWRVIVFTGQVGFAPEQKGWTSFKVVR